MTGYRVGWLLAGLLPGIGVGLAALAVPAVALVLLAVAGAAGGLMLGPHLTHWPTLRRHSIGAGSLGLLTLTGLLAALDWAGTAILGDSPPGSTRRHAPPATPAAAGASTGEVSSTPGDPSRIPWPPPAGVPPSTFPIQRRGRDLCR